MIVGIFNDFGMKAFSKLFPAGKIPLVSAIPIDYIHPDGDGKPVIGKTYKADFKQFTPHQQVIVVKMFEVVHGETPDQTLAFINEKGFVPFDPVYIHRVDVQRQNQ